MVGFPGRVPGQSVKPWLCRQANNPVLHRVVSLLKPSWQPFSTCGETAGSSKLTFLGRKMIQGVKHYLINHFHLTPVYIKTCRAQSSWDKYSEGAAIRFPSPCISKHFMWTTCLLLMPVHFLDLLVWTDPVFAVSPYRCNKTKTFNHS